MKKSGFSNLLSGKTTYAIDMKEIVVKKAERYKKRLSDDLKSTYSIGLDDLAKSAELNPPAFINYLSFIKGTINRNKLQALNEKQMAIVQEFFKEGNDAFFNTLVIEYLEEIVGYENDATLQKMLKPYMDPIFRGVGEQLFIEEAYGTLLSKYDFKE